MGYRHYFYKVTKKAIDSVKNLSYSCLGNYAARNGVEVDHDDENNPKKVTHFYFNDEKFLNKECVFEFGKLYFEDTAEQIYKLGVPLFNKKEVQEKFSDYKPYVVGKDAVLKAIEIYKKKIIDYYNDLLIDDIPHEKIPNLNKNLGEVLTAEEKQKDFFDSKIRWLQYLVNTDLECKWELTDSWEYEYGIFNLVHLLKTINWDKETLLFYGW